MILFIKHVEIEGPETLGPFFAAKGFRLMTANLHDGDGLPADPHGLDAVIPLGGPMNVYEEDAYPFLREENVFLKKVLAARVPVLGICLGAQLLCKAAGGKVVSSPRKEIGWFTVDLTKEGKKDPLFQGLPDPLEVYQWHGDMCEPSQGVATLASSPDCPVQAIRVGTNAYGFQFHAEITDKSINDWTRNFLFPGQADEREKMLKYYGKIKAGFHRNGQMLCENFIKVMKGT